MEKVVQANREDASPAFEDILSRLNTVVERLESGELPLEESLKLFEDGVRLSRMGSARLDEAERRVERLLHSEARSSSIDGTVRVTTEPLNDAGLKETEVP